jgi:hypothetical protein
MRPFLIRMLGAAVHFIMLWFAVRLTVLALSRFRLAKPYWRLDPDKELPTGRVNICGYLEPPKSSLL